MISSIVACLGLGVSIMTFLYFKKQIAMMARKLRGEEIRQRRARLACETIAEGVGKYIVKIYNRGEAEARNIQISYDAEEIKNLRFRGLNAFPYPHLQAGEHITLRVSRVYSERRERNGYTFHFIFEDDCSKENETDLTFNLW